MLIPCPHGGDLGEAERLFPGAPQPWLDLSTGINPLPYPVGPIPAEAWRRLPSPAATARLERAAAAAYGVSDAETVVAAPGTQSLISLLPRVLSLPPTKGVAVLGPTYAEHLAAWRLAGQPVAVCSSATLPRLALDPGIGIVVVVNPNNPDGRILSAAALREAAAGLAQRGGWLVVDEAFADLEEPFGFESLAPARPPRTIVLRSFGKSYGLAGLRVGAAVSDADVAARIRTGLGPWAVSGPALAIASDAFADRAWLAEASAARRADASRLAAFLAPFGRVIGGLCLFRLLESADAEHLFRHLGRAGIWVRRFAERPDRLRFGLPGCPRDWDRLAETLASARRNEAARPCPG